MTTSTQALNVFACELQGSKLCCSIRSYGLHFEASDSKKLSGFVVKWFHLIGCTYDSEKSPTLVDLYHARKQTFGTSGFRDKDPAPEETGDAKSLTIAKYPKLYFQQLALSFTTEKLAKRMHKAIQKRLRLLGQLPGAKWHVFLNPFSGTKKARKTWNTFEPWLKVAGVEAQVTETQYSGHCEQEAAQIDLAGIDLFVSVSGDGMVHELLNGLMKRKDWHRAVQIPIAVVPSGTGNALATSLMFPTPQSAILAAIKRQWKPLDLLAMYQYTPPLTDVATLDEASPRRTEPIATSPAQSSMGPNPSTTPPSSKAPVATTSRASEKAVPERSPSDPPSVAADTDLREETPRRKRPSKPKTKKQAEVASEDVTPSTSPLLESNTSPLSDEESRKKTAPTEVDHLQSPGTPEPELDSPRSASSGAASPRSTSPFRSSSPKPSKPNTMAARNRMALREEDTVRQPGTWNLVCYAFQAFLWGFLSDVDIETESWRWMGEFRYTLGTLRRIAALRHYPARLLTLDLDDAESHMETCKFHGPCVCCQAGLMMHHERHEKMELNFGPDASISSPRKTAASTEEEDDADLIVPPRKPKTLNSVPGVSGNPADITNGDSATPSAVPASPDTVEGKKRRKKAKSVTDTAKEEVHNGIASDALAVEDVGASALDVDISAPSVPSEKKRKRKDRSAAVEFDTPATSGPTNVMSGLAPGLENIIDFDPMNDQTVLPGGWNEHNSKFVCLVASNVSHLASDLRIAPFAHPCGGSVDLIYFENIPKMEILDLLSGSLENGRYISSPRVTYKKVRAFVLIPTGKPGIVDLDGEEYETLPTAIEVHPGVLRVCVAVWNLVLKPEDV